MKLIDPYRHFGIVFLRTGIVFVLIAAGWLIYKRLPPAIEPSQQESGTAILQILLRQPGEGSPENLNVSVDLYRVDIVAVQHEYFTERRPAKPFWEFFRERMKGRSHVMAQLDKEGHGSVLLSTGTWWLHATLTGDEELEWRLPVSINGSKQVVELTPQNVYTRSKTF